MAALNKKATQTTRQRRWKTTVAGALLTVLAIASAARPVHAQNYSVLYSFTGSPDGANPVAGLVRDSAGNLYGTTQGGGSSNSGTVYKLDPSDSETVLHSFTGGSDGGSPFARLVMDSAGNLYGTTLAGGNSFSGTVFKVDSSGIETVLYSFAGGNDGALPVAGLIMDSAGNLYGTTDAGGAANDGTVFKLDRSGNETVLHAFTGSDGAHPEGGLLLDSAGNLYGSTRDGGSSGNGTVYRVGPSGQETVLWSFKGGKDGANPEGDLVMDRLGNLYGTTQVGGSSGNGTVFKVEIHSGHETVLHSFAGGSDGALPYARLVMDGSGNLYGTTQNGGTSNDGTVFKVDPFHGETVLHSFTGSNGDGAIPFGAGLILDSSRNLYGATQIGGTSGNGTVFKLTLP